MFKRKSSPESFGTIGGNSTDIDPWAPVPQSPAEAWASAPGIDMWNSTPEARTGPALWGEQNVGGAAVSLVLDATPSGFMSRANWGPDGRVVSGLQTAQNVLETASRYTDHGLVRAAEKIPVAGNYVRTAGNVIRVAQAASNEVNQWGGVTGVAQGIDGVMRDPRAAMEIARDSGGAALGDGLRAAFESLKGEVTVEKRDGRRRLGIGKIARLAAKFLKSGGASGVDMLIDASSAGMTAASESAKVYAKELPGQFAGIPSQPLDAWSAPVPAAVNGNATQYNPYNSGW